MSLHPAPLVSVMIPMYNVAPFVARCLQSVLAQDYPALEVVLVDDASQDASLQIARDTIAATPHTAQVKIVVHRHNQGLAMARATALQASGGEWLLWLDSDDYWHNPQVVSRWVARARETGAAVVAADYIADYPKRQEYRSLPRITDGRRYAIAILRGETPGFMHNKLIARAHFLRYAMPWQAGQNLLEDYGSVIPLLYHTPQVAYLEGVAPVHYVQYNSGAYTKQVRPGQIEAMVGLVDRLQEFMQPQAAHDNELRAALPLSYWTVKRLLLPTAPLSSYRTIARVAPQTNKYLGQVSAPWHERLIMYCQVHRPLFILGYLLNKAKRIIKDKLRY